MIHKQIESTLFFQQLLNKTSKIKPENIEERLELYSKLLHSEAIELLEYKKTGDTIELRDALIDLFVLGNAILWIIGDEFIIPKENLTINPTYKDVYIEAIMSCGFIDAQIYVEESDDLKYDHIYLQISDLLYLIMDMYATSTLLTENSLLKDFTEINESNNSKFCSKEKCEYSVSTIYKNADVEMKSLGKGLYGIYSTSNRIDDWPMGKLLKPNSYFKPDLVNV